MSRYRVVATTSGWTGGLDELAALLSRRARRPAETLRGDLLAGETLVREDLDHDAAEALVDELAAFGIAAEIIGRGATTHPDAAADEARPTFIKPEARANTVIASGAPARVDDDDEPLEVERNAPPPAVDAWARVLGDKLDEAPRPAPARPEVASTPAPKEAPDAPPGEGRLPRAQVYDGPRAPAVTGASFDQAEPAELLDQRARTAREAMDRHSPIVAGLLSLAAPGAGQAYNGERARALTFTITGILLVPWVVSFVDAVRAGDRIRRGDKVMAHRSSPVMAGVIIGVFWAIVLGGWLGLYLATAETRARQIEHLTAAVDLRQVVDIGPGTDISGAPDGAPDGGSGESAMTEEERVQLVSNLIDTAQRACADGFWQRCYDFASRAISTDPSAREAYQLQFDALENGALPTTQ